MEERGREEGEHTSKINTGVTTWQATTNKSSAGWTHPPAQLKGAL
jgi:hypothetical protein